MLSLPSLTTEFLSRCAEVYQALQQDPHLSPDPVVVPTSEEMAPPVHPPSQLNGNHVTGDQSDGVDSMLFFRALLPVCEKLDLKWVTTFGNYDVNIFNNSA